MILSFHPIIEADKNIICAGRPPDPDDLAAIQRADAVILPQGCPEALYRMARSNCRNIFPNMDIRYDFPGKCGQIRLFREIGMAHPASRLFATMADFDEKALADFLPAVVKLDWGGQGDTVFKVDDRQSLRSVMDRIRAFENTGQTGFLIQKFIPTASRSLRVVVIGDTFISYWRIPENPDQFGDSVAKGARIEHDSEPKLQSAGRSAARLLCRKTGLQLAGLDFIFTQKDEARGPLEPLILEINYFFGRTGLGGSDKFYALFTEATDAWLHGLGLNRN